MNREPFARLHGLRMENDAAKYRQEEMRPRFARMAARHENGTAPRAVVAHQLFQTPVELAQRLVTAAGVRQGDRVLEPSAGLGRLLDALPAGCAAVAIERAAACAAELFRQNRPSLDLRQADFFDKTPVGLGLFDRVVMNPPFTMRADIRHILHALKFLKPGGVLAALCLNTKHREAALRPLAATWEEIPEGVFAKEGTSARTVLLTIQN